MRDINFRSIPFNRASVSITAALYDKRALDCTSDRPLIYSLNHLIYLASSSARVRETLAMDGGIERLASILRECIIDQSTKKPFNSPADEEKFKFFAAWKWTLALQCMVFISTRGSEEIRRRVVSCGILPIIATVLKNYIEIMAKPKSTRLASCPIIDQTNEPRRNLATHVQSTPSIDSLRRDNTHRPRQSTLRRSHDQQNRHTQELIASRAISPAASVVSSVAPSLVSTITTASNEVDNLSLAEQTPTISDPMPSIISDSSTATAGPSRSVPTDDDTEMTSISSLNHTTSSEDTLPSIQPRRLLIQNQFRQHSLDNDNNNNNNNTNTNANTNTNTPTTNTPPFNVRNIPLTGNPIPDAQNNITNRPATPTNRPMDSLRNSQRDHLSSSPPRIYMNGKIVPCEYDIIWSLEILAFVSKYAHLREKLQNTHLIPAMSITHEDIFPEQHIKIKSSTEEPTFDEMDVDEDPCSGSCQHHQYESTHATYVDTDDDDDEMLESEAHFDYDNYDFECEQDIDPDFQGPANNIFAIVELFTARQFSQEVQYWAGVIMRNSCRRDDSKGGIRQCASFECGKWEETPKQFAKCRRCKRTKYCSKQCQLKSWNYHRHWCVPPNHSSRASTTSSQSGTSTATASTSRSQLEHVHHHHNHPGHTQLQAAVQPQLQNTPFPQQPQQILLSLPVMGGTTGDAIPGAPLAQFPQMQGLALTEQDPAPAAPINMIQPNVVLGGPANMGQQIANTVQREPEIA